MKKNEDAYKTHPHSIVMKWSGDLLTLLHLSLQLSEHVNVAKRCAGCNVLNLRSIVLLRSTGLLGGSTLLLTGGILEGAAVAENNALAVLVELDDLEGQNLTLLGLAAVLLLQVLGSSEAFNVLVELDDSTLLEQFGNLTLVDRTNGELLLEYIPRIVLELLVTERETAVLLVDVENDNVDLCTYLGEL